MNTYKETFATWDKVAALYQDKFMDLSLYDDTYDAFCEQLTKPQPDILEIGCGPGNITRYILRKRPDFAIYGIDIAPKMVELAKKNNPTAQFGVMDSRDIDSLVRKFDAIICGFCLPYLSELDAIKLIADFKNILADNGLVYLSFVAGKSQQSGYQTGSSGDRTYFYYHDLEKIKTLFAANNLVESGLFLKKYKKSDGSEEIHTIILAKKQT
ncbi:MAG: hypothetical protein RI894_1100 [Bacteroidota bacterium]|jgi:SAM-dependent methyltransferase